MAAVSCSRLIVAGVVALAFVHAAPTALAQASYPVKPLRILVGFAPGGFTDIAARIVGQQLGDTLGQQVIVENRPGANGLIAGDLTAKSAPDGYTLFMSSAGLTTNPVLYNRMQRDPLKDFAAVSLVAGIPNLLVVHPAVPARSVKELLALARSRPETLTQASAGTGSPGHLSGELLQQMTQTRFVHIPYKGSGPAMIDLIGGHVDLSFPAIGTGIPHVKAGKLRALGTTTAKRSPLLPDVPTIAEAGVPGYEVVGWYGIVGPAGMPKDVTLRLSAEIARILRIAEVREKMLQEGAEPIGNSPEEFAVFLAEDQRKWAKVIKAANLRPSQI
jgi:tripartite-type tricarboxylate transporter receptor subunit TctC